jgi:hypothetical protein
MREQWALLDSNQRASDYESPTAPRAANNLAPVPSARPSQRVAQDCSESHALATEVATSAAGFRGGDRERGARPSGRHGRVSAVRRLALVAARHDAVRGPVLVVRAGVGR